MMDRPRDEVQSPTLRWTLYARYSRLRYHRPRAPIPLRYDSYRRTVQRGDDYTRPAIRVNVLRPSVFPHTRQPSIVTYNRGQSHLDSIVKLTVREMDSAKLGTALLYSSSTCSPIQSLPVVSLGTVWFLHIVVQKMHPSLPAFWWGAPCSSKQCRRIWALIFR